VIWVNVYKAIKINGFWEVLEDPGHEADNKDYRKEGRNGQGPVLPLNWPGRRPEQISLGRLGKSNRYLRMPE
jgi:hypothetical protein